MAVKGMHVPQRGGERNMAVVCSYHTCGGKFPPSHPSWSVLQNPQLQQWSCWLSFFGWGPEVGYLWAICKDNLVNCSPPVRYDCWYNMYVVISPPPPPPMYVLCMFVKCYSPCFTCSESSHFSLVPPSGALWHKLGLSATYGHHCWASNWV